MKKQIMLMSLFLIAMFTGCSHDESTEAVDRKQTSVSAEFVNADEAKTIAAAVHFGTAEATTADGKATTRSADLNKEVESITPVPDASGATAFYVINYRGGGFMLLAADKRVNPVLAFSEEGTFPMNDPAGFPDGLVNWMDDTKAHVQDVRMKNEPLTETMAAAWEPEAIQAMAKPNHPLPSTPPNDDDSGSNSGDCKDKYQGVDQLLTTKWHQRPSFNDLAPLLNCGPLLGDRALAGCIAVAMAQVMKYHRYPRLYNWHNMPDTWATIETAKLMRDIGDAVHMNYGCEGSGAQRREVARALVQNFHYSSAKFDDYDPDKVIRELRAKRPVILFGGDFGKKGRLIEDHAWVCDGWWDLVKYDKYCKPTYSRCFHMNWGWLDDSFNGWYTYHDWRPGGSVHNNKKRMVYEIIP